MMMVMMLMMVMMVMMVMVMVMVVMIMMVTLCFSSLLLYVLVVCCVIQAKVRHYIAMSFCRYTIGKIIVFHIRLIKFLSSSSQGMQQFGL